MRLLLNWLDNLTLQQQAVLVMSCRGFDGTTKHSAHKPLVRTLRAHCLNAAKFGRAWKIEDGYSDFMTLNYIQSDTKWNKTCEEFISEWDSYNVHAVLHLVHAAEVLGYTIPIEEYRVRWGNLYDFLCRECLHVRPEPHGAMNERLNDWDRFLWEPREELNV